MLVYYSWNLECSRDMMGGDESHLNWQWSREEIFPSCHSHWQNRRQTVNSLLNPSEWVGPIRLLDNEISALGLAIPGK